jgi:diguanylate cyclase (GGDEF)-like protein
MQPARAGIRPPDPWYPRMPETESSTAPGSLDLRYEVLLGLGQALGRADSEAELHSVLHRQVSRVLEADGFYVSRYDEESDMATVVFWAEGNTVSHQRLSYPGVDSPVLRSGEATLVRDGLADHSLLVLEGEGREPTRSAISAPMRLRHRTVGVVSAQSYRADAYDESDREFLQSLADLAAAFSNLVRVQEERTWDRGALQGIDRVLKILTSAPNMDEVLESVANELTAILEVDGVATLLFTADGTVVKGGTGALEATSAEVLPDSPELRAALESGEDCIIVDEGRAGSLLGSSLLDRLADTAMVALVPLRSGGEVTGALLVTSRNPESLEPPRALIAGRFGDCASIAVHHSRLQERLLSLSLTDSLTGLPNRRHLESHLDREVAAARRGRPVSAVIFDLDNFKRYNDAFGHAAGDRILRTLGQVLSGETRAMNLVARYGGDEFVAVLSDTTLAGARLHAARVEDRVAAHPGLGPHGITVTSGVATWEAGMGTSRDLIQAADKDLYSRKGNSANDPPSGAEKVPS